MKAELEGEREKAAEREARLLEDQRNVPSGLSL